MPRSFDFSADYPASVAQIHSAFADEQYWRSRLADSGADAATLDSLEVHDDGGITVATTQILHSDKLPGIVTQLHRGDLHIKREERWGAVVDGRCTAAINAAIEGAPVKVTGGAALNPSASGAGARMTLDASVEVRIPLVGRKVESFIGTQLVELLTTEQRFTTGWVRTR